MMQKKRQRKKKGTTNGIFFDGCAFYLVENQFTVYKFGSSITDIIHLLDPFHLVGCFEFFGNTFFFGVLFYQPRKELLGLFLCIGKEGMKFSGSEQIVIQNFAMVL